MIALTEENGLRLVAGATHPFADWREQDIYPDERTGRSSRTCRSSRAPT